MKFNVRTLARLSCLALVVAIIIALGAGPAAVPSGAHGCAPPPSRMVGWWTGDGDPFDIKGTNHGTALAGATYAAGKVGQAFKFDGVAANVEVPDSPALSPANAITIDAWFAVTPNGNFQFFVNKFDHLNGYNDDSYNIGLTPGNNFRFQLDTKPGGTGYADNNMEVPAPAGVNPFDGNFHFIAATYDGSAMRLYIDGVLAGTMPASGPINQTNKPLMIGSGMGNNLVKNWFMKGQLDEVEIFDRALSETEIQALHHAGSSGKCRTGLGTPTPTATPSASPTPSATPAGCSINVTVPGTANPWLAGMPNGSTDAGWDSAPAQSPVLVSGIDVTGGTIISATGSVGNCPGCNSPSPEGSGYTGHATGASNGIAQVGVPINSLVGVFLDDSRPDLTPAPAALDFSTAQARDYQAISPVLKQPFFIGDGKTSGGAAQQIIAPAGAKRLYLGVMDGIGWYNNVGSFQVVITRQNCSSTCSADVTVPGTSNPYLAGMAVGATDNGWDSVPHDSPALVSGITITPGAEYTFSATGAVHLGDGNFAPPDGLNWYANLHYASNGVGGYQGPANALMGVFLPATAPDATPAPASVNLYTVGFNNAVNTPALKQLFFIGDGKTSGGVTQRFVAPAGAARLYLATGDGFGWFNNAGSFQVTVGGDCNGATPTPTPTPTPGTCGQSATAPGGVFVTGQDPDFHAALGGNALGAQHILQRAVAYVTGGKTSPRMLLVTDLVSPGGVNSDPRLGLQASGFTTFDVADHGSGQQGALNLNTVQFSNYDVIVVASDFGGWLRQDELDILNARKDDIIAYVNGGGGLVALAQSGQNIYSGGPFPTTTGNRYGFLPFITSSVGLDQANSANTLTPAGLAMGLVNSDLNGNFTHNIFTSTGGMDVIEVDGNGRVITLATKRRIGDGGVQACGGEPPVVTGGLPGEGGLLGPGAAGNPGQVSTVVTGTGSAGCTVRLKVSDPHVTGGLNNQTYTTQVDAAGNWSIPVTFEDCDPFVEIVQVCDGVESEPVRRHFHVDGTPPSFIGAGPAADETVYLGGGSTTTVLIDGSAADADTSHCAGACPGVTYEWYSIGSGGSRTRLGGGGAGGTLVTYAGGPGSGLSISLGAGDYEFEIVVIDGAGNRLVYRCRRHVVAAQSLTITGGLPEEGGIYGPGTPGTPGRVRRTVTGTGNPGCRVDIKVSDATHPDSARNNQTYSTTVGEDGKWSLDLELDDCHPVVEVVQVCDGTPGETIRRQIYVDGTPPEFTTGGPSDGFDYVGSGGTAHVVLSGAAGDGDTHVPNSVLSYEWHLLGGGGTRTLLGGGGSTGTLTGGGSGLEIDLQPGGYDIEVKVCDTAGNCTVKVCHRVVRRPLTLTGGLPQTGGIMGPGTGYTVVGAGGRVRTRLTGKGEPNCTVEIKVSDPSHAESALNNTTYTVQVDAQGDWALDIELDDCHPVIEIRQVCDGEAGEVIRRQVYIDTTPPASGLSDRTVYVGAGGTATVLLEAAGVDEHSHVAGNSLTYRWYLVGASRTLLCAGCPGAYELTRGVGEYTLEVEITDTAGNKTVKRCVVRVLRRPTELVCQSTSVNFAGVVTLNYTLKDKLTGEVLTRPIKYLLNGGEIASTFEAYLVPGFYNIAAEFAGDEQYESCATDGSSCPLEVRTTPGKITGGGSLDESVRNFGFVVQTKAQGGATSYTGNFEFQDKSKGYNLKSQSITLIAVAADRKRGVFTGTATVNGATGYTFTVWLEDLAEPGALVDKFRVVVNGPGGFAYDSQTYATLEGKLDRGGNVQIHKAQ